MKKDSLYSKKNFISYLNYIYYSSEFEKESYVKRVVSDKFHVRLIYQKEFEMYYFLDLQSLHPKTCVEIGFSLETYIHKRIIEMVFTNVYYLGKRQSTSLEKDTYQIEIDTKGSYTKFCNILEKYSYSFEKLEQGLFEIVLLL